MNEHVHHSPERSPVDALELHKMVHGLLEMLTSLSFFRAKDDTSIAWEDGEIDEEDAA